MLLPQGEVLVDGVNVKKIMNIELSEIKVGIVGRKQYFLKVL